MTNMTGVTIRREWLRTQTQREGHGKTQGKDGHLRAKERGLRTSQPVSILPTPWSQITSPQNYEKINLYCLSPPPMVPCHGSLSRLMHDP